MISLSALQSALEKNSGRLRRRDQLWSTARVIVFCLFLALTLYFSLNSKRFGIAASYVCAATGFGIFVFLVFLHRKTSDLLHRYDALGILIQREKARASLDWTRIPATPPLPPSWQAPRIFLDLDLLAPMASSPSILRLIDCTVSTRGWQRLLQVFENDSAGSDEIRRRQKAVEELLARPTLRRRVQLAAQQESREPLRTELLEKLFEECSFPARARKWFWILGVPQLLLAAGWILQATGHTLSLAGVAWGWGYVVPFLLYRAMQSRLAEVEHSFDQALSLQIELESFLPLASELERMAFATGTEISRILRPFQDERSPSRQIRRLDRVIAWMSVRGHPVAHLMVNLFFPWDLFWALRLEEAKRSLQKSLPAWLEALAGFEVVLSLAEFSALQVRQGAKTCLSQWLEPASERLLEATDLRHPLLPAGKQIGNPVRLDHEKRCLLITGSNMSGKSTFLRTIGVNLLLARAGARVLAESFQVRNFTLKSCLRITDSLTDQISSFYAEVKALKEILDEARQAQASSASPVLIYLIDEIFRGTNNRERLQGSRAYIRSLVRMQRVAGLIATHDLELTELAHHERSVENLHFRERIENGRMVFDFRVAQGPSPSTNALKVMELSGLPTSETD